MHRTIADAVLDVSSVTIARRCFDLPLVTDLAALSQDNRRNRPAKDLRVEQQRPIVHVVKIETYPALEVRIRASADLPEPCQSRLHEQPRIVLPVIGSHVV